MSVLINASTSTGLIQSADTSGEIELQSNGTTALKVNTNEGIQILNCLGVGNATPSTSGAGITFPATKSPSSDANTLDDYEEGTWTPALNSFTVNSGTFAGTGTYTKIGNMVTVLLYQTSGNVSWTGGSSFINGLPFAPNNTLGGAGSYTNGSPSVQGSVLTYKSGGGAGQLWMASSQSSQTAFIITATYFI
jgi:hypothetical protein